MKTTTNPTELTNRAEILEDYASRYRELARMMSSANITEVEVTGAATFEKAVDHLGGNTRRLQLQVQKVIDSQR